MRLIELDGIGTKTSLLFEKLEISSVEDLVTYYPKRYEVIRRSDMDTIGDNDRVIIDGIVEGVPITRQLSKGLRKMMFRMGNSKGLYNIVVYNQTYLLKGLTYGVKIIVIGKYDRFKNIIVASEVRFGFLPEEPVIESIYSTTEGLNRKVIAKAVDMAINSNIDIVDYVPDYFIDKYHFMRKIDAIREMHRPSNVNSFKLAKQRLKYEELFFYLVRIRYLKECNNNSCSDFSIKNFDDSLVDEFIKSLSFELTLDQIKTISEIKEDMRARKQMNRLVQGDVGSGKTIVAFVASYINYLAGFQSALMVPTEILARQHYEGALELFKNTDMVVALLTSNITKKEKDKILEDISNGEIDFVIGTQALIQDSVNFKRLGLIIADEQHRFGVNQRKVLKDKGIVPDVLAMSATPIPRTYALTIYGDMDVSSIKTKPKGRKEVSTFCKRESEIVDVLRLMKSEIDKRHQVYVIAPSIANDDSDELDNVFKLREKMNLAFGKICRVDCVHGQMSGDEKKGIMHEFESGDIKILISTTVIEVGVNVPNATMIVIFQANLFGLSTLHQLRGRVGRGSDQGYCILLSKEKCDRLEVMESTSDGFLISEYDFKNRGEGDLFGTRQSGDALFKLADIRRDFLMLVKVKKDVDNLFDNNFYGSNYLSYLEKAGNLN